MQGCRDAMPGDFAAASRYIWVMTVVINTLDKLRHPEKAHRPDNEIQRKPDWIRVKAPVSREYVATREIVRENNVYRWAGSMLLDAARLRKRGEMERVTSGDGPPHGGSNVVDMFRHGRVAAL